MHRKLDGYDVDKIRRAAVNCYNVSRSTAVLSIVLLYFLLLFIISSLFFVFCFFRRISLFVITLLTYNMSRAAFATRTWTE